MMKIACLVSITVLVQLANSAPNPLDDVNIHLHLGELIKKATAAGGGGGADYSDAISVDAGNDYMKKKVAPKAAGKGNDYSYNGYNGYAYNDGDCCTWSTTTLRTTTLRTTTEPTSIEAVGSVSASNICKSVRCTGKRTQLQINCCNFGK